MIPDDVLCTWKRSVTSGPEGEYSLDFGDGWDESTILEGGRGVTSTSTSTSTSSTSTSTLSGYMPSEEGVYSLVIEAVDNYVKICPEGEEFEEFC